MLEEERVPGLLGVAVDSGEEYAQASNDEMPWQQHSQ